MDGRTRRLAAGTAAAALTLSGLSALGPAAVLAGDPCYHGFDLPARTTAATTEIKAR